MPLKIIRPDHLEIIGTGFVLLTAPHAASPHADLHTGRIVEDTALLAKCYALIGKVSREYEDLNRIESAKSHFRESISRTIQDNKIRCIIDVHGKHESGVEIGTAKGQTATETTTLIIQNILSRDFKQVTLNQRFSGHEQGTIITTYGENMDQSNIEAVQLEFGHEERTFQKTLIVNSLADIVGILNQTFSASVRNLGQGTGNNLDHGNPRAREDSNNED